MSKLYKDYIWKDGIPYGIQAIENCHSLCYKIPMDPYRKRIAIEKYDKGHFQSVIYDSGLFDFRHLNPSEQTAWQKTSLYESNEQAISAIYNQYDRLILIETYFFERGLCRSCRSSSGHGIFLSEQRILYECLGDTFNGVILLDANDHPVMSKRYKSDEISGEFTELLEELWDGSLIQSCYNFLTPLN